MSCFVLREEVQFRHVAACVGYVALQLRFVACNLSTWLYFCVLYFVLRYQTSNWGELATRRLQRGSLPFEPDVGTRTCAQSVVVWSRTNRLGDGVGSVGTVHIVNTPRNFKGSSVAVIPCDVLLGAFCCVGTPLLASGHLRLVCIVMLV